MNSGFILSLLNKATKIEANEVKAVLVSFSFIFTILASYYIIRPVRDAMASDWTDVELSTIWTLTFLISFLVVSIYGYVCSKVKFKNLVPGVYGFFAATFYLLYFFTNAFPDLNLINQIFYVWVSVFSLLNISVFWSFMADTYKQEQSRRLFGFIASGSSLGAIFGPAVSFFLAEKVGSNELILISATMLLVPIFIVLYLQKIKETELANTSAAEYNEQAIGSGILAGFKEFALKPILLGIGLFIFIYTGISTFVYFEIKNILIDVDPDSRTQIWAGIDLAVNVLAVITGMFGTSRLATKFGLKVTLPLVPIIIAGLLFLLALSPILWAVVGLQIIRRAGEYSITKPAREMLFTLVDRESRFKAKSVIDVVIYRGGDIFWAWSFTGLTQVMGLGLGGIAIVGGFIATLWSYVALRLGRTFDESQIFDKSP
ncbi:MAG: MFS transporter [Gammaproteobacteria bacterium]|nr:MFS transporter [Gammaproteobacteria bacterium]